MLKSALLLILVSFFKFASPIEWKIDGVVECKENIHGLGEFSFLLQEATVNFWERDWPDPDDHKDGPALTDSFGHFHVEGHEFETFSVEPYLEIDHQCYTPTSKQPLLNVKNKFYQFIF